MILIRLKRSFERATACELARLMPDPQLAVVMGEHNLRCRGTQPFHARDPIVPVEEQNGAGALVMFLELAIIRWSV